ncbi:putative mitochondrial Alanyl-tRNA synthetase [Leptomonas pyrrhocoris]|uniref:Alanine--tRNA ligase n=1 Tax=Leptomonas pyrrhocoris TaxID=157538 RepID=A0A0M9G9X5_LEPPY|nr:putative mitochondrial Alanyl-tRNA synthetase [Leptomonas pyrrhocoris]XP_015664250.1 putative mitochondrial Alanyl-tRNA synthetase [Leptomonas pyrrhocoris]XP_015664251.1 putative mitochondrial Alanyl-tRNA synthetase [Leptomonas pyrrhocoris]XP_015664252.1 putative mitochondrial Alanyl-tRNA synthetase [Leptomonas pyrrhocoris]KPA85810.1 putative mitochondrial Alanyl-tRNA synthetase [Leptomonas pyrrhocoris]KPA85811.1 putative mitochondrial Alanyl-tRNA synthetase [Leptomonas pyrrhocoris]KPA8581|eukprot:XP_015664249.1 putative mitochondrial Alanyl-tRNA synthetase [Leptomonas pyrrhocoris]
MSSIEWPVGRVRQQFVDFFTERQHTFVPSCPVVPHNDPTLLFNNAGMNQFKSIFLGTADPNTEFGRLKRAANSQLCIRAGGKHNDLEDVGRDTYHHTFFEMLGSWSFGDYFKKEAIPWAWELLTEVYKLPKNQLYVTYFEGDEKNGLAPDLEAKALWAQFLPESQIIPGNAKDNFWEMGDTGPCGPCSEVHFDRIGGRNAADLVNKDDPMVVEIWNLVFIQYERRTDGTLVSLPQRHIDTGMGLERLTSILQDVKSNYDTDAWIPIFEEIQKVTGYPKSYMEIRNEADNDAVVAYRVVADHIRCLTTAVGDGAMPDSVGRGFVLRRIIRRAVRYGVQFLNAKPGFFAALVDSVCTSLGPFFPHLQDPRNVQRIKAVLTDEEQSFAKTWEIGLKHFNHAVEEGKASNSKVISGSEAFVLHDRYGFPVDLTCLLAEKAGMTVDLDDFNSEMKANQVSAGRVAAARTFIDVHQIEELKSRGIPQTEDNAKYTWEETTGDVIAIFDKKNDKFVSLLAPQNGLGEEGVGIITTSTNFYAESGGQIYDTGRLIAAEDCVFEVRKVYNVAGYVVHVGNLSKDSTAPIPPSAVVHMQVDYKRRQPVAVNHTTTHELNWVLRRVLEEENPNSFMEVQQKGSLVTDELLRFDFSYNAKMSNEELQRVEKLLNKKIQADLPVYREEVALADALKINGLRHMFGEKYPDPVSVVSIGAPIDAMLADPENAKWREYSVEFCGGTHLNNLKKADKAVILSDEALMKGVRRIVVATKADADKAIQAGAELQAQFDALSHDTATAANVKALSVLNKKVGDSAVPLVLKNELRDGIDVAIKKMNAALKEQAADAKEKAAAAGAALGESYDAAAAPFLVQQVSDFGAEREPLQAFADAFSSTVKGPVGVFLVGSDGDKALAIVSMPSAFVEKKLSAVTWAKSSIGKGGGKPNAAQSGLPDKQVAAALAKATAEAEKMKACL